MIARFFNPVGRCCADECTPDFQPAEILEAHLNGTSTSSTTEVLVETERFRGVLPRGPKERAVRTYSSMALRFEDLQGEVFFRGRIMHLRLGESTYEMELCLHANGFHMCSVDPRKDGRVETVCQAWSPFSLIEKCQVKAYEKTADWAVFKVTVFRAESSDKSLYFACSGDAAYRERERWVAEITHAISRVTASLFPPHAIAVLPVPWVPHTNTRIMAGYLLQCRARDAVSVLYCELHAYNSGMARLTTYKDEWCDDEVACVVLCDASVVSTRKGAYCTVFGVDDHRFCTRTHEEKELWLRAISNIKVKLMFQAPDPTEEEISLFRSAVRERIDKMGYRVEDAQTRPLPPLLSRIDRAPNISNVAGDTHAEPGEHSDSEDDEASDADAPWFAKLDAAESWPPGPQLAADIWGAAAASAVPSEPAVNSTVHVTEKHLPVNVAASAESPARQKAPGGIPLLAWSPGRRQAAQHAI